MPCRPRFFLRSALPASLLVVAGAAFGADLVLTVTGADGRPLRDAVVMATPARGALAVKPMPMVSVSQAARAFDPSVTVITAGTAVSFPNNDTVRHHVYSFSAVKTFEIKLYAGVPHAPVVFDKPGVAVLGCNIHDQMVAWIVVTDTPLHARTDAKGQARLPGLVAGDYGLRTWHPALPVDRPLPVLRTTVGTADVELPVRLAVTAP
jgi:plastocyanin